MISYIIFILPLLVVVDAQTNCSLYNLCGNNGYCYNDTGNQWFCECRFWWEGSTCNRQSANGKEVIILGVITAVLFFAFYGIKIGRSIYRKLKSRKEIKEIIEVPKFATIAIDHVRKTTKLKSCIIVGLMIILATVTLIIQWALLRNIHKDIVAKYLLTPDEPLYFDRVPFCDILDLQQFNIFTFPFACFVVLLCIVFTKRKSLLKNVCHGYIAPAIPVDFLSHTDRKLAAIVFAMIADELMSIVYLLINGSGETSGGVLVKYLLRLLQVLFMGLRFFPILAAVYMKSIFILACTTIYVWLEFSFTIVSDGLCDPDYYPTYDDYLDGSTDVNDKLKYYGTGSALVAIQICSNIPRYLCTAYISIKIPTMLIEKIYIHCKKKPSEEKQAWHSLSREEKNLLLVSRPDSVEMLYCKNLFTPPDQRPASKALIARLIPKFIYEWRDDFRYSARVLCLYSSIFLLFFFIIIWICLAVVATLDSIQKNLLDTVDTIANAFIDDEQNVDKPSFPIPKLIRPFFLAVAMTSTITLIQLLVLLASIRRNLIQAFRGDDSEIPRRNRANYVSYATGNFHFAGYFIGYFIWGFIIIAALSVVICVCIEAFIVFGTVRFLEKILKAIIPTLLLIIFKVYLNKLIAQFILLQDFGDVLALNNRRYFMILIYFNFFLDAFLGFISSIIRFVKGILAGIIYMCRMDYSLLGRKLETFDSGFAAYCGFIHTECTHRHPVMLVFVSHLYDEVKRKQYKLKHVYVGDQITSEKSAIEQKKSARYIRKWRLAAFLVRNPVVIFFRKTYLRQLSAGTRRALNDVDNNNEFNVQKGMAFYVRHMTGQQPDFIPKNNSSQELFTRF